MIIKNVQISRIKIKRSRRAINKAKVGEIADSIALLGRKTLPSIYTEKGIKADLLEIDENLIRHDLTILERAEQLHKRKLLYAQISCMTSTVQTTQCLGPPMRSNMSIMPSPVQTV